MRAAGLILWFSAWLLFSTQMSAQGTAVVSGHVIASSGVGLSGVRITLRNATAGIDRSVITLADGDYVFVDVPAGRPFEMIASMPGFATVSRPPVAFVANQRATVDFTLFASTEETLTVAGRAPTFEQDRSTVQQTISEQLAHTLPLIGRDFIALASLTAGFSGNPSYPSPQGQIYWSNNVLVDGASHYSKWRGAARTFYSGYGLETIKEVQVLTSQYSAEYGDALATVTTAVTNSGTNELHGSGLVFIQDDSLDDRPAFSATTPPSNAQRFGMTLGGPIVKNATHFFGSYEGRRSRAKNIVVSPAAVGTTATDNEDEHLAFFKVDHAINDRQRVTARYNGQRFRWHNEPGGLSLPGTGVGYANDVHTLLMTHTSVLAGDALNQLRVQFARYTDVRRDLQPSVYVLRTGYSEEGGTIGPEGFGADPEDTWEAADTLARKRGPHALKGGAGFKYVRSTNVSLPYGRGAYFFAGPPAVAPLPYAFIQGIAGSADAAVAEPRSLSTFLFFQDDWALMPRVSLNLGLRYDVESIRNVRGYDVSADRNNLQPRIGAAWQPTDDPLLVRGGVGLYNQQHLLYAINKVQLEGPDGILSLSLAPGSRLMPTFPNVLPASLPTVPPRDIQVVDPSFSNPYSVQATAGVERRLFGVLLTADFVYLAGRDLMSLVDINAPQSVQKPAQRTVAEADATRPVIPASNGYRKVISLGNRGRSWYRGLQIKGDRATGPIQLMASYTLANAEDEANYLLPEDSRNLAAEKARADNDIRHNLAVGLTWQLQGVRPWSSGWSLAGFGQFRSNRPYTITWGDDRNGTTQNDARPGGRNTAKTGTFTNIDVALVKRLKLASRIIEARMEAFNVFSTTHYDEYVGSLASPLFGQPVTAFPPRRLQLAAIVRF